MGIIGSYKNGNYKVLIMDDGTKIRYNNEDSLIPSTIESFDFKITNKCNMNCPFCHENSTIYGSHGDIMNYSFIDKLHPFTEIAIGGGNPLEHPDLEHFLVKLKSLKQIPSMTVNQKHFIENYDYIKYLVDNKLIYGIGVSLTNVTDELIEKARTIPSAVIHVINGIVTMPQLDELARNNLKLLILGYKEFRRGENLYSNYKEKEHIDGHKADLKRYIKEIIDQNLFKVVSFDNLAVEQLDIKSIMSEKDWEQFYQGGDGTHTMFIDAVSNTFARSSTAPLDKRYPIMDTVEEMFEVIKHE